MDGLVAELLEGARAEMAVVAEHGGAVAAVDYMKAALVDSHRERLRRIEGGEQIVVGLNKLHRDRALAPAAGRRRRHPDRRPGRRGRAARGARALARRARPGRRRRRAGRAARASRQADENIMPATIAAARAGVDDRRVGGSAARRLRRVPRADRRRRGRRAAARSGRPGACATRSTASARRSGAG